MDLKDFEKDAQLVDKALDCNKNIKVTEVVQIVNKFLFDNKSEFYNNATLDFLKAVGDNGSKYQTYALNFFLSFCATILNHVETTKKNTKSKKKGV